MKLKTIKQVVEHKQCIGCGLCALENGISMEISEGVIRPDAISNTAILEASCPSKGYDLKKIGQDLFGDAYFRPEIGFYQSIRMAHSSREDFLKNASSGGMMTEIASSLLAKGIVQGVITTRFVIKDNKVRTETCVATSTQDLINGQGSKYCPTSTLSVLKLLDPQKKYLLIGTPCQIAGFRLYSQQIDQLKEQIPFTIANFCGGYRDYKELDYFVTSVAHIDKVKFFRHRGGGQPGSMRIEGADGEVFQFPYPAYAKLSHFVKNERCTLCMDATGELADFACGDAWLEEKDKTAPWSIVIARSKKAEEFLEVLISESKIVSSGFLTEEQVIKSQRLNITSKKYRQFKRIRVRDFLLMYSPNWSDNYATRGGSYFGEIKILLSKAKAKLQKS